MLLGVHQGLIDIMRGGFESDGLNDWLGHVYLLVVKTVKQ
jgi:hypothetical protein